MSEAWQANGAAVPVGESCRSCGEALRGPWCHSCGQGHRHLRLSAAALTAEVVEDVASLDTRLLRTVRGLSLEPGRVCRDYLSCRRVPWMHPVKYALLMGAFAFLVQRGFLELVDLPDDEHLQQQVALQRDWGELLNFLVMPLFALAMRWCFPRSGLRWVEHFVVVAYGFGHLFLVQTCLVPLQLVEGVVARSAVLTSALLPYGYFTWLAVGTWGARWPWALLRVVLAWTLVTGLFGVAVVLVLRVLP